MLRYSLALFVLTAANPAAALLSPYYDSAEKISAILASAEVADALHQAPIGAVSNTGTTKDGYDIWLVRVQECDLEVHLIPVPPAGVGKVTYKVELAGACQ